MKYILLFLLSLPAGAQAPMCGPNHDQQCVVGGTVKAKDVFSLMGVTTASFWTPPPSPEWHDFIDKKGAYHADFTDPNNEFRCEVTSYLVMSPHNVLDDGGTTTFTLICSKPHEVKHEDEPKPKDVK